MGIRCKGVRRCSIGRWKFADALKCQADGSGARSLMRWLSRQGRVDL